MLPVGAKAHRCAVCRVNFVALGRRRSEFVSSWKQKQLQQRQADAQAAETQRLESAGAPQPPGNEAEETVV